MILNPLAILTPVCHLKTSGSGGLPLTGKAEPATPRKSLIRVSCLIGCCTVEPDCCNPAGPVGLDPAGCCTAALDCCNPAGLEPAAGCIAENRGSR